MDYISDISDQAILADVTAFLTRGTASQKKQLRRFLQAQPSHATLDALLPVKELPLKLELIREIHKLIDEDFTAPDKPFHLSNIKISALILMSIDTLRDLRQHPSWVINPFTPQYSLPLLIQGKLPGCESRSASKASDGSFKSISQNAKEREKCHLRDQRACVLTRAADARTCYIVPFALTANQANISSFCNSLFLNNLLGDAGMQIYRIMARGFLGALDKSWNMLSLHPTLCTWWSECLFGLKYLGTVTNDNGRPVVQIQFHWMPRNWVIPDQLVEPPYDKAIDAMLQAVVTDEQRDSFPDLESGKTFEILVDTVEEALNMKAALDFQWVAVRLAAMSGAARVWELGHDSYKDENDDDGNPETSEFED